MTSSWAQVASAKIVPTPQQRLEALKAFYSRQTQRLILCEAFGANSALLNGMPAIAAPLVEHMITICIDTEASTHNTDLLTEVGLNQLKRSDARTVASAPGAHGLRIMEKMQFLHLRVAEYAHLLTNQVGSQGPLGNRFGHTCFATFAELRVILHHLFNQPIESNDPALKGCMRPVVLLGHALENDEENSKKEGLDYDFAANKTIVAKIDTQSLAFELGVWKPQPGMLTNKIGLRVLIEEQAMFRHVDDHTACNDAARTTMCAIWMIMPPSCKQSQSQTMQQVATQIEKQSKDMSLGEYGTVKCCTRCASRDHLDNECKADIICAACARFDSGVGSWNYSKTHIETYCYHVAQFRAWARRYRDANIKFQAAGRAFSKEVLAGPGASAHPWSTWQKSNRPHWPLTQRSQVLEGMSMSKEPAPVARNMQSALNGLPLPATGMWILLGQSNAVNIAPNPPSVQAVPSLPPANNSSVPAFGPTGRHSALTSRGGAGSGRGGRGRRGGRGGGDPPAPNPYGWID